MSRILGGGYRDVGGKVYPSQTEIGMMAAYTFSPSKSQKPASTSEALY
jgi:hypothetical protein